MKRVYIIHGWDGHPKENWFPWLKKELESRGFEVFVPQLPEPGLPEINSWVSKLAETVMSPDEETYFVGHSMGCQTIVRYLESLPNETRVGGAIFVAGFFKRLTNLEDEEDVRKIAEQWLEAPLDFSKARPHVPKSVAIFSDNDPWVPLDNQDDFRDKLGSKIIIEHNKSHFNSDANVIELPVVLEELLMMAE